MTQTALITGGAVRIGKEIALCLADEGWDMVIHCNRSQKASKALAGLIEKKGRKTHLVKADLSDAKAVAQLIPSLIKKGIKLDCLINCAALFEKDNLSVLNIKSWQLHMNVNLYAPLQLMRDFAEHYKGKAGNIINITDGMTGWSISPEFLSYSLSKLGLANATQLLATELAPNIRVNAIAPGATIEGKNDTKDTYTKLKNITPLKRNSSPQEVCDAVKYLLKAPSVTGQILSLSGGLHLPYVTKGNY